ncbi:uncharacterized protein LOC124146819 [Haliotis rufescens]|uniref:uncharacterized protein LOC124146819 n=1 Tax=Haliotis rufescens TaxID=6454 RepID=UPI001EB04E36|nr:uncharacterized protein LOC124146819 [Haliotis rufescens]
MYRLNLIRQHPHVRDVVALWECDFKKMQKTDAKLGEFVKNMGRQSGGADDAGSFTPPLDPRNGFYGGRTNGVCLHRKCTEGEKIKYVDVCSLYPYICKYGRFPTGHPTVLYAPPIEQLFDIHGMIQCRVLPPGDLYHPVLPYRTNDKLYFPLCRTCADTGYSAGPCPHDDDQRSWTSTYATVELHHAVRECGYRVLKIYDAWHFDSFEQYDPHTAQGGLFTGYVDAFFKMKQESSGYPVHCDTEQKKQQYVQEVFRKEGVMLDASQIAPNPGKRAISKSLLNNLWGKLSQRNNMDANVFVSDLPQFYNILRNADIEVKDISLINEDVLLITYATTNQSVTPHGASNVAIASWVTAQARLKLYSGIHPLGDRCLYFDTDSIIYVHKESEPCPTIGDSLGEWTDEIEEGNWIDEFTTCGPKNYAYKLHHTDKKGTRTICKIRGFTLNVRANKEVNIEKMIEIVNHPDRNGISVPVPYPHKIHRKGLKRGCGIISRCESRAYRFVYTKRRIVPDPNTNHLTYTLPYGFKLW